MNYLKLYQELIQEACSKFDVKSLYAFGSVLTSEFNKDSDIDFIVTLKSNDPIKYGENYFALKESLQNILSRNVDLLEFKALKEGKFLNLIDSQKQLVYEGAS